VSKQEASTGILIDMIDLTPSSEENPMGIKMGAIEGIAPK